MASKNCITTRLPRLAQCAHNGYAMLGFNWIDLIIILLLAGSVWLSLKLGFVNLVLVTTSFFGALFLSGWLIPHLLPISDRTLKTIVNANLVLLISLYAAAKGYDLSRRLHWGFKYQRRKPSPRALDAVLGCLPGLAGSLIIIWLVGVMLSRMPFAGLSNSVADAKTVQSLVKVLPPVPAVFAEFNRQVNPNTPPSVLATPKPSGDFNYSAAAVQQAADQAQASVVRITGFGCGGIVTGSGFVAGPDLVATNAHVLAGVKRPIVKYRDRSFEGTPVLFDAGRDIAFLRLKGLPAPVLPLETLSNPAGQTVALLGYPKGNYTVEPGIIRNDFPVFARNIYDVGLFKRQVYEIQATVDAGSSGSPVILPDGRITGMVFSKSDDLPDYAYALAASELQAPLAQALKSHHRVGTGACLMN